MSKNGGFAVNFIEKVVCLRRFIRVAENGIIFMANFIVMMISLQ